MGLLPEHRVCFNLLCDIVDLFRLRSAAPQHIAKLDRVLYHHHVMYLYLYPDLGRPKLHYVRHLPQCIEQYGTVLSCFSTERKHKRSKQVAAFSYRNFTKTLLAHEIVQLRTSLSKGDTFDVVHLLQVKQENVDMSELAEGATMNCAVAICTEKGTFYKDDLVVWKSGEQLSVGHCQQFLRLSAGPYVAFVVRVERLTALGGALFSLQDTTSELVEARCITASRASRMAGASLYVMLPAVP